MLQLWSGAAWYWSDVVEWSSIYAVEWSGVVSTLVLLIGVKSKMKVVSAIEDRGVSAAERNGMLAVALLLRRVMWQHA